MCLCLSSVCFVLWPSRPLWRSDSLVCRPHFPQTRLGKQGKRETLGRTDSQRRKISFLTHTEFINDKATHYYIWAYQINACPRRPCFAVALGTLYSVKVYVSHDRCFAFSYNLMIPTFDILLSTTCEIYRNSPHKTESKTIELLFFFLITNLTHFYNVFIYLFHFSTCFEQPSAHHQENLLYQYIIWYISLCVCRSLTRMPDGHIHRVTYTRWCIDTIDSPDDEHWVPWSM
jgi:hypothetical protein